MSGVFWILFCLEVRQSQIVPLVAVFRLMLAAAVTKRHWLQHRGLSDNCHHSLPHWHSLTCMCVVLWDWLHSVYHKIWLHLFLYCVVILFQSFIWINMQTLPVPSLKCVAKELLLCQIYFLFSLLIKACPFTQVTEVKKKIFRGLSCSTFRGLLTYLDPFEFITFTGRYLKQNVLKQWSRGPVYSRL